MNEIFGISPSSLLAVLAVALGVAAGAIAVLAVRNRVLVRLGVRNVGRRRGRTALIVVGLMLGTTIIAAALTTGDTMSHTIRKTAVEALGHTDVLVSARGAGQAIEGGVGASTGTQYFPQDAADDVAAALEPEGLADGVAPAIIEHVALQTPATRQSEPAATLFAPDPARMQGFGTIRNLEGEETPLTALGPGQVFLNREAADELRARPGDPVLVFTGPVPATLTVGDVVDFEGTGTADSAVLMPLAAAQDLLDQEGLVKHVLVSARGDDTSGADLSDQVLAALEPVESARGLEAVAAKQDAIELADEVGNAFMALFTAFGTFSIAAGILLIFLIFVMLASERRAELGIARAVGTRRGHLVQMFVYEGLAYDIAAAIVGALLGAAVAYGMVLILAEALQSESIGGLQVEYALNPRSLAIAIGMGLLLTLAVVAVSAWRVSVMTISTAIRGLPDPPKRRRARWIAGLVAMALGLLLAASGVNDERTTPLWLGVAIILMGLVPVLRALRVPERVAYTGVGTTLVVIFLLPWSWWEDVFGELGGDFSTWITTGLVIVLGAAWVIIYNADVLLGLLTRTLGRMKALAPVLRTAVAYPLAARFRTGATFAMFTLVVFTLVTGVVTSGSFNKTYQDVEAYGTGFDIRAATGPTAPIDDMGAAIDGAPDVAAADFTTIASLSVLSVDAQQVGTGRPLENYIARGLDRSYLDHTTLELGALARGYTSNREVWDALAESPGLAVVDSVVVPRRDAFGGPITETDFRVTGFFVDDGTFEAFPVRVRDPQAERETTLRIIGVLSDTAPFDMIGISTSQETLAAAFPGRTRPTVHLLETAPGVDPAEIAPRLESAFLSSGLEAETMQSLVDDITEVNNLFDRLIQGFMGLGLVVGVVALGVISARAVVERRQQIGVLRALGFRRRMVQTMFLLESSFIALTAIVVGTALGLMLSYQIVVDSRRQPSWQNLELTVPWANLGVIFAAVYLVALAATLAPSMRASRVAPAEALRYQ